MLSKSIYQGSSPWAGAMRYWYSGNTSRCQRDVAGPSPTYRTTYFVSSAGRAPPLQGGCRRSDPVTEYHIIYNE